MQTEVHKREERVIGEFEKMTLDGRGLLTRLGRNWVPKRGNNREKLLEEAHKSRFSIHPGATKMYRDLRESYWWPGMKMDVVVYVERFVTCRKVKAEHQKSHGKLQPLEIPEWKWEHITMNFITKLPNTRRGFDTTW